MVHLDPPVYRCPEHPDVDLTGQVELQAEEEGVPVSYVRRGKRRPFLFIVACPGSLAGGDEHEQSCQGEYWK